MCIYIDTTHALTVCACVIDRTYNDVCYLQYRLEARQELAKMGLDVSRNQMLRINLQVAYV